MTKMKFQGGIDSDASAEVKTAWLLDHGIHWACAQALVAYETEHHPVGGFLHSVLSNKMVEATLKADANNLCHLEVYAYYLYNYMDRASWGSEYVVMKWLAKWKETAS